VRKKTAEFPPIGQGCKPHFVKVGIYHKREFCFCEAHSYLELNKCEGCGQYFHTDRRNAKTCSDKCRQRVSRKKRKEKKEKRYLTINTRAGVVRQEVLW
jgi:predicted nucleic acid-binding Zn ribbon protein